MFFQSSFSFPPLYYQSSVKMESKKDLLVTAERLSKDDPQKIALDKFMIIIRKMKDSLYSPLTASTRKCVYVPRRPEMKPWIPSIVDFKILIKLAKTVIKVLRKRHFITIYHPVFISADDTVSSTVTFAVYKSSSGKKTTGALSKVLLAPDGVEMYDGKGDDVTTAILEQEYDKKPKRLGGFSLLAEIPKAFQKAMNLKESRTSYVYMTVWFVSYIRYHGLLRGGRPSIIILDDRLKEMFRENYFRDYMKRSFDGKSIFYTEFQKIIFQNCKSLKLIPSVEHLVEKDRLMELRKWLAAMGKIDKQLIYYREVIKKSRGKKDSKMIIEICRLNLDYLLKRKKSYDVDIQERAEEFSF